MTTDATGTGDPGRTLALLWRRAVAAPAAGRGRRRGPRQGRTVDEIVDAAIALADAAGLDAVTMRAVAQALGIAPMSLYTYLPGKGELLDLMLDTVYARMPRPDRSGRSWRARAAAVAADNRTLYAAHPWAAAVTTGRPPLGPGLMAKYDYELRAFDDTGLDDVRRDAALTYLLDFVRAAARTAGETRAVRRDSARSEQEWWAANGPLLARVLDEREYPLAVRVGAAAGAAQGAAYDPDRAYEFGLARVLDGLAALIEKT
ncbi:TetR/AcrR family transcriptional regulator C-terminal domain-containing protein [Plantactinospora siamensis]|uniref:TetR/AcrR family transcriptional regulator C-terminal domain-containing protein n=1 Tax=Plantactinospora siamensis TaxID=555372 RepID=A0ABV6NPR5_9ACTN